MLDQPVLLGYDQIVRLAVVMLALCCGCSSSFRELDAGPDADLPADAAPDTGWELVYVDDKAEQDESLNAIWVAGQDQVFAVGDNGQSVWHEQGQWIALNKSKGLDLYGVWGRSQTDVYAVGRYELGQKAAIQHYDGTSWTALGPLPETMMPLSDVWGTPTGTKLYFTSLEGTVYTKTSTTPYEVVVQTGGCPDVSDPPPVLWGIDGSSFDNALLVGDDGLSAHRDYDGWMRLCHPDKDVRYRAVFSVPGTTEFYMGASYLGLWLHQGRDKPTLKIHEDRGTPGADQRYLWSIWGTSAARIIAVGDAGTILYFDGSGDGPRQLPSPTQGALFGVSGFDERNVYICGEGNRIWKGKLP